MPLRNFSQNQYNPALASYVDQFNNYGNVVPQYQAGMNLQAGLPPLAGSVPLQYMPHLPANPPVNTQQTPVASQQNLIPSSIPTDVSSTVATQPPVPDAATATSNSQVLKTWNSAFNNAPVEKTPPVNVVITSSDPLPPHNTVSTQAQSSMSVTIPPQHIKSNSIATPVTATPPSKANPTITAALQDTFAKKTTPSATGTPNTTPSLAQQKVIFGSANTSTPNDKTKSEASKPNPFASFSFGAGTTTTSPTVNLANQPVHQTDPKPALSSFANIFGGIGKTATTPLPQTNQSIASTISSLPPAQETETNTSKDDEDEYVPTAHFEPVIALPDLVEVKTGEENEIILFEHRAKLLRFVRESKEWKERGIGNIKVLVNKDDKNKVRLLMRREQVLKLCCNQLLKKDTQFKELPNSKVALSWYGQDYSENELQLELLAIRFKTADLCKQFHEAILKAQAEMNDDTNVKEKSPEEASLVAKNKTDPPPALGFGDQFKPKAGSWTCEGCYLTNDGTHSKCPACNAPKDKNAVDTKVADTSTTTSAPKFLFGAQPSTDGFKFGASKETESKLTVPANSKPAIAASSSLGGFGDKFKPKPGSWSCSACYTSNTEENLYCIACEGPKDSTVPKKPASNSFETIGSFLIQNNNNCMHLDDLLCIYIWSIASSTKFTFGSQPSQADAPPAFSFGSTGGFTFGSNPTATINAPTSVPDVPKLEAKEFGFVFKPKSPGKVKSPLKAQVEGYEDVTDDENIEEEENNTYFTPGMT